MAKSSSRGAALAAELCQRWGVSRASGKFALDAVMAVVAQGTDNRGGPNDGNQLVHHVTSLVLLLLPTDHSPHSQPGMWDHALTRPMGCRSYRTCGESNSLRYF